MDRVWKSRGRAGSGFGQSGSGSGRVFADFESRVRVLHGRVSGFCQVYNLCKKVDFLKKIYTIFEGERFFFNFFKFMIIFHAIFKRYLKKKVK